jgi:tetratricopeptide (TPR) repeat protein
MKRFLLAGVFVGFGVLALALGRPWRAKSAESVDGNAAYAHAQQGTTFLQQHLYRAAIDEFEAATRKSPRALDPWVGLAAVHIRLGDGRRAVEDAGKAVDIAGNSAEAQIILGRAHWLARNPGEAEKAALKAQELLPANLQAAELLLNVYFDRRDDEKFQKAFNLIEKPHRPIADLGIAFAVRRGEFRKAHDLQNRFDRHDLEIRTLRLELALKREPGRMELYPQWIRNLIRLGRPREALAARSAYTGSTPLDFEMGKAHWLAGNREEAIRAYERASAGIRHKLSAEIALAAITGDRRHWLEAFRAERIEKDYFVLAQLEDFLKTASPLDKAFAYRYAGLFDDDLFNRSAEHALEVLKEDPDHFDALMIIGTDYFRLGRLDDAARYVQLGADRYPDRAEVWSRLGQLALTRGAAAAAAPMMEKAVRLEPSNPSYLYNYGWLLDQLERDREAMPYYERAIAASPLSFEAMNNLALLESEAGNSARAISLLSRAVTSNPENEMAYLNRGNYHAAQRSWRDALADYTRALELNPLNGFAAVESARTHLELDRADIAIEELDSALDSDPNLREAYVLLATAYEKKGRKREAAAALEEAKRITGDSRRGKAPQ